MLIVAIPAGVLADKLRRQTLLKSGGITGICACILLVITLLVQSMDMMYVSMFLWGAYRGVQSPALAALFADSLPTGKRSKLMAVKKSVEMLGASMAPLLSVVIFLIVGNEWTPSVLIPVLLTGLGLSLIPSLMLFLFKDDRALKKGSDMKITSLPTNNVGTTINDNAHANASTKRRFRRRKCVPDKWIPYVLASCDMITATGAGMTIKYFPLFFMEIYGLTPISLNLMFFLQPLFVAILIFYAQKVSVRIGRIEIVVVSRILSIACLFALAFVHGYKYLIMVVFLMRGALMNCARPLIRSVLMDYTLKKNRAKWNSLESIAKFTWTGSAVLGGLLVDMRGYRYCFFITGFIYLFGTLLQCFLIGSVRPEITTDATHTPSKAAGTGEYKYQHVNVMMNDNLPTGTGDVSEDSVLLKQSDAQS